MLTPPPDLGRAELIHALSDRWGLVVASLEYQPVGFGSHHWTVAEADGTQWFLTVDVVADGGFDRLEAALSTAADLFEAGLTFVVAPVATSTGEPVVKIDERFTGALYPFVAGKSYRWGHKQTPEERRQLLGLLARLHAVPVASTPGAFADDFVVPHRNLLECDADDFARDTRPYAAGVVDLLVANAAPIASLLSRYDALVHRVREDAPRLVVTHGEPHPGNTMLTAQGLVLIDWDTVLLAPAERDLWIIGGDDDPAIEGYDGTTPQPWLLDLYRTRWEIADLAAFTNQLVASESASPDGDEAWRLLQILFRELPG